VVFASLEATETLSAKGTDLIVQPQDRSTYGQLLPPGRYHKVVFQRIDDVMFGEAADGIITMLTNVGGPYLVTGS
jgi:hypothetical protein